ncbi:MAG: metal-dependent hydrolase [Bacteroidetes bacterium]|nr:MAG: metal-dependent hydrolase [Bacteroidota bacterium]
MEPEIPNIPSDISVTIREPRPKRPFRLYDRIIWWLNIAAALMLGLSYFAPWVSPAVFWPVAFLGLGYGVLALANLLFAAYFALRKRKRAFVSLVVLLAGFPVFGLHYCFTSKEADFSAGTFKVMSYNTKLFDLYNWSHNAQTRSKMFDMMLNEKPDLLCLQEFYTEDTGSLRNFDTLKAILGLPYAHSEYTITLRKTDHWGIATFSRYPIVNQGSIVFNNRSNNICIYSDMLIRGDTVRVYNMHLQSIRFGYADQQFIHNITHGKETEDEIENSKNIMRRVKRAFTRRAGQAESIARHISSSPYPVIVCGDFNDTPISYAYHTISEKLEDAFLESGSGMGRTFSEYPLVPRIDYILHSPYYEASGFTVIKKELSDHYPVVCRLKKK